MMFQLKAMQEVKYQLCAYPNSDTVEKKKNTLILNGTTSLEF